MEITKAEIKKMVHDEVVSLINSELDRKIAELMKRKNSKTHDATTDVSKDVIEKLYRFMYLKRNIWRKDLG